MNRTIHLKYTDVIVITVDSVAYSFECCREAAEWMYDHFLCRSVNAAKVGISNVLTGKRRYYKHMTVSAVRSDTYGHKTV